MIVSIKRASSFCERVFACRNSAVTPFLLFMAAQMANAYYYTHNKMSLRCLMLIARFGAFRISPERTDKLWTQFNNQQKNMGGLKRRTSSQHTATAKQSRLILYLADGITSAPLRQKLAVQWRLRNHCKESFLISMLGRESAHSDMFL